jgi:phage terminase small subunit
MDITQRMRRFCEEYVVCGNGAEACRRAGYSHKSSVQMAKRLMKDERCKAYISELNAGMKAEAIVNAGWVLAEAKRAYEIAMADVKPVLNKNGKHAKDEEGNLLFRVDLGQALKALELIGKHAAVEAFGKDTQDINVNLGETIKQLNEGKADGSLYEPIREPTKQLH